MKRESVQVELLSGTEDLRDAMEVRRVVFTEEQGISPELDLDGLDSECDHYVGYVDGDPVAVTRVRHTGPGQAKIERVATVEGHRNRGIGTELTRKIISDLSRKDVLEVNLSAQTTARDFYERMGFEVIGEEYEEAGIPHVRMTKWLGRSGILATGSLGTITQ